MTIQYDTIIGTGFYQHFNLLKKHNLFEKNYQNSHFKTLFQKDIEVFNNNQFSTVVAFINHQPIGFLLFEHFELPDSGSFVFQGTKRQFSTFGTLMIYVSPEHRNIGIASHMVKLFENSFLPYIENKVNLHNKYIMINSLDKAFNITKKSLEHFIPSFTQRNSAKNKQDLIGYIRFYTKYKPYTKS